MTVQASANHDEEIYIEPERFNVTRKQIAHQSFGNGPHFGLGANLARRMIGDIMLPLLFDRFPKMSLIPSTPVNWEGFGFRGPVVLPVKLN